MSSESTRNPGAAVDPASSPGEALPYAGASTFLAAIVASSDDAIVGKTLDGVVRSWNPAAERIFGYTAEEAVGRHISLIIPPEHRAEEDEILARLRRGERVRHFETIRVRKDGERIHVSLTISPVRDAEGVVIGASKVARDITPQKRAKEEILRHRKTLEAVIDAAPMAIAVLDGDGIVRLWNRAAERIFGWTKAEVTGTLSPAVPPERLDEFREHIRSTLEGEPLAGKETVRVTKSGDPVDLALWSAVLPGSRDEPDRIVSIAVDVTERKAVERSLAESESRFQALADHIDQLAWMADPDGSILWYNERWFEFTGATFDEMEGDGWRAVHHPDHLDRVVTEFRRAIEVGEEWEDTFPLRSRDGSYHWFLSRAHPIRDEDGQILRWFGTNTDITERIEMEEALLEADRRKNEFLATLAHELRNPLAPIRSGVQLLERAREDPELLSEITLTLQRQTDHLVRLVDDLMDISRINRGKIELRRDRIELATVLESAIEISRPMRVEKGHGLGLELPDEPIWLHADSTRLTQVFGNLLNNAAKYTPEGGDLALTAEAARDDVTVRIVDSGRGIPEAMLADIFEPFVQGRDEGEGSRTGLGIGLTLVRSIVSLHGGSVEARSPGPGRGSEFEVRLPRAEAPTAVEGTAASPQRSARDETSDPPLRILVVDDNRDAADALVTLLELEGHHARAVYDGRAVLELGPGYRPDAVILDLGMPDLDGYETARALRETGWGHGVTLVALTGWSQPRDRDRTRSAGFDHHLIKPVEIDGLTEVLAAGGRSPAGGGS